MKRKRQLKLIWKSVFAGILIAIAGVAYLSLPNVIGALMFNFGLISVICFGATLYTGYAGFIKLKQPKDYWSLALILIGNAIGTALVGYAISIARPNLILSAANIINSRLDLSIPQLLICGSFCGILMTTAVKFAKATKVNWMPLIFAIPLFILSGFCHSIADAFYISLISFGGLIQPTWVAISAVLSMWLWIVLGNFIGCNIPRLFVDIYDE